MSAAEQPTPGYVCVVSRYPLITHTFIQREVRALRARGMRVETVSIRQVDEGQILSPVDAEEFRSTHALRPTTATVLARAHLRALARGPLAYIRTLRGALALGGSSAHGLLWQLFYFGQAILLWDWMTSRGLRHVHAHHGNVASDVAMLATRFGNASSVGDTGPGARWTWSLTVHGSVDLLDARGHRLPAKVADADAVVCVSDFGRSQLMTYTAPEDWGKLQVIRAGIDASAFKPASQPARNGASVEILTVAALSQGKGYAILLEALAMLRREGLDVHATFVGDGPERTRFEANAAALALDGSVQFAGAVGQDRIREFYRRASIFCLPSFAEGIPVVLMEAMAMEIPVVTTHIMGIPELVEDGRSGLLVPPGRADMLAEALGRLVRDPDLRARMGAHGRERVESEYDIRETAEALRAVLTAVIAD